MQRVLFKSIAQPHCLLVIMDFITLLYRQTLDSLRVRLNMCLVVLAYCSVTYVFCGDIIAILFVRISLAAWETGYRTNLNNTKNWPIKCRQIVRQQFIASAYECHRRGYSSANVSSA